MPIYIIDDCVKRNEPCNIWITQPRKIAARTVSLRIAERSPLWEQHFPAIVGYSVGLDKCVHADTRITYMTPGIVTRTMHTNEKVTSVFLVPNYYFIIDINTLSMSCIFSKNQIEMRKKEKRKIMQERIMATIELKIRYNGTKIWRRVFTTYEDCFTSEDGNKYKESHHRKLFWR